MSTYIHTCHVITGVTNGLVGSDLFIYWTELLNTVNCTGTLATDDCADYKSLLSMIE
jgi:hypothetical protein